MAFQKFKKVGSANISIYAGGTIKFNSALVSTLGIDHPEYVNLYFEPETNSVGIELLSKACKGEDSYRVVSTTYGFEFKPSGFLNAHKIVAPSKHSEVSVKNLEGKTFLVFKAKVAQ
jgi:hypothetical protein